MSAAWQLWTYRSGRDWLTRQKQKARRTSSPRASNCLAVYYFWDSGSYPNSRTVAAGTSVVLVQQHEQRQFRPAPTMRRFYSAGEEIAKDGLGRAGERRPGQSQGSLAPGHGRRYAARVMNSFGASICCCRGQKASGIPHAVEAPVLRQ